MPLHKLPLLLLLTTLILTPVPILAAASPATDLYCAELHLPLAATSAPAPQPFLGVAFEPASSQATAELSFCPKLVRITSVIRGSAAWQAGLAEGDLILSLDGQAVCNGEAPAGLDLRAAIARRQSGDTIVLALQRDGERLERSAHLGSRPRYHAAEVLRPDPVCPTGKSRLHRVLEGQGQTENFSRVAAALADRADLLHNLAAEQQQVGNPRQLREFTGMMRHPLRAGLTARLIGEPFLQASGNVADPTVAAGLLANLADIDLVAPPRLREVTLSSLVAALEAASARISAQLAKLSTEELRLLRRGFVKVEEGDEWNSYVSASLKVDLAAMVEALAPLLGFFTDDGLVRLRQDLFERFPESSAGLLFQANTPAGLVLVGGTGNDSYDRDAALILDLGGDDLYRNNAGGSREGMPVAVVVDWDGDDRYLAPESFSQGAGLLGGGFLFDLAGRDLFVAHDGSQGAGLFGIGILSHRGEEGIFQSRRLSQGVGQTGLGLLCGGRGKTLYRSGEKGQGFGAFGGVGVLVDQGGDDIYQLGGLLPDFRDPQRATVSMGQGFGYGIRADGDNDCISGGIGLLLDARGNDTYLADYFAQGASYYFGVGILHDLAGNDRYLAGRYAQGAGIHSSVGILLDDGGDDSYHATVGVAQGIGHDYGFGLLQDENGNDRYDGGSLIQGAATSGGLGLLLDVSGRNDFRSADKSAGYAEVESGIGLFLGLGTGD